MKKNDFYDSGGMTMSILRKNLLKMKLTILAFLISVVQLIASQSQAQTTRLNLNLKDATVEDVLMRIEKQSNYYFIYNREAVNVSRKVDVSFVDQKISDVLSTLFRGTGVEYEIQDRHIILKSAASEVSQQKAVSGVVSDVSGAPLPGVSVVIKGTTEGTITDANGNYSFAKATDKTILVFSFVGMKSQEVAVAGKSVINITLEEETVGIEEVVAIGYGQQKKVSITGAVGNIKSKSINQLANNTTAAMQGASPGLTILDKGGSPGRGNTTLRIRGITTINNSDALLLVDGVEQRISDINPDDIESVSILKDASTTAIYGSRAANGVVLITTKRGKAGDMKIDLNTYWGTQSVTNRPEHMETVTYMRQQNYAFQNAGQKARYSEAYIQEWINKHDSDPITYRKANQWQDAVYSNALQQNYSLTVSGGNEKARGLMGLRYYKQDGVVTNFNSDIKELRVNTDFKPYERLKLSADANFRSRYSLAPVGAYDYDVLGGGIFYSMFHATQFVVPRYADGTYGLGNKNANPLLLAEKNGNDEQWNNLFIGSLKGELNLFEGLKFTTQFAQRFGYNKRVAFTNAYTAVDTNFLDWTATAKEEPYNPSVTRKRTRSITRNSMDDYREDLNEYTLNLLLDYEKKIGKHSLHGLAGFSQIQNKWSHNQAYRQDFYNNEVQSINMGSESSWKAYGYNNEYALRSFFGRVNYNYADRYLLEANLRYDGTSRFTGDNQFGTFPSFSAGWRISNEAFWSEGLRNIIPDLKLRGSWGKAGNQTAGLYDFYESYTSTTYDFNGQIVQGYMQTALANKNLMWETSTQTDIGLDAGLLGSKLTVSADYYYKRTDGILVNLPISGTIGLDAPVQNAAIVDNKGFELSIDWKQTKRDWSYGLNFNISNNKNKVISLGGANPTISGGASDVMTTIREGYAINSYWGYLTDGLLTQKDFDNAYPVYDSRMTLGDVKYVDRNGDKKIDAADMTVIGNEFPKLPFSLSGNVNWKGFDFAFMLQGVMEAQTRVSGALAEGGNFEGFTLDIFKDYWTPDNTDARFPRPRKSVDYNSMMSDYWVIDASYIRLKNVSMGYTVPRNLSKKLFVEKARVYVAGSNVLTFSPLKEWGLDPEFVSGRFLYYPQTSVYTIGLNLTF
jgi:TonB-linked SusC/RagA family outer membrane protein